MKRLICGGVFVVLSVAPMGASNEQVQRIEIASIHWTADMKGRATPKTFWEGARRSARLQTKGAYFLGEMRDESLLRQIATRFKGVTSLSDSGSCDIRLSCLLHRTNGSVDTLSFGPGGCMQVNQLHGKADTTLRTMIASNLPTHHRGLIEYDNSR